MTPLDDIALVLVAAVWGVTSLGLRGMRLAQWFAEQEAWGDPMLARARAFAERRKVLERQREHALDNARRAATQGDNGTATAWSSYRREADEALIALAKEELEDT